MKLTSTLLLMLITGALVFAIVRLEKHVPSTAEKEAMARNPIVFDASQADQIEIESKQGRVRLSRRDGRWLVASPFDDLADPEKVSRIFGEIEGAEWLETLRKEEFVDDAWKKTRLHDTLIRLQVKGGGRLLSEVSFGSATAVEACHYALLEGKKNQKTYHVVRTALPELISLPAAEWRDPKLVRFSAESVRGIVLATGIGSVELSRSADDGEWSLVKPLQTWAGEERVNDLLSTLANLKILALEAAGSGTTASAAPGSAGGAANDLLVRLDIVNGTPLEIKLKKPSDQETGASGSVSNRDARFTVAGENMISLWAQPNDLRENRLARFEQNTVEEIRITSGAHPGVVLQKQDNTWFMPRHGKNEPANGERAAILLEALRTHRIREFVADSASQLETYGLDKPFLTLAWKVTGGAQSVLTFGQDAQGSVYAKYVSQPFVYRVAAAVLAAFPPDPVKWKGLAPLHFSIFSLQRIVRTVGTSPPLTLDYDTSSARWSGTLAGKDITASIDRVRADRLATLLSRFQVSDWVEDRTVAFQLLRSPAIQFQILLKDPLPGESETRPVNLSFAPTQAGMDTAIYYGQIEGRPDVFFITRESLRQLIEPVLKN
jgi:hypothetical protein